MITGPNPWGAKTAAQEIIYAMQGGAVDPEHVSRQLCSMAMNLGFPQHMVAHAPPMTLLLFLVAKLMEEVAP